MIHLSLLMYVEGYDALPDDLGDPDKGRSKQGWDVTKPNQAYPGPEGGVHEPSFKEQRHKVLFRTGGSSDNLLLLHEGRYGQVGDEAERSKEQLIENDLFYDGSTRWEDSVQESIPRNKS